MAFIKPFSALRPKKELAAAIAAKPYDVLNSEEARAAADGNPYSFLHITKAEIDLPRDIDVHSPTVYKKAKENLDRFTTEGFLYHDDQPCYYVYQLIMNGRSQTGLVCISSVNDYFTDKIRKHEFTRPEKEKDRIDHMLAIQAQTGNVFLAYRDVKSINQLVEKWKDDHAPDYDLLADDNVQHSVWAIHETDTIDRITRIFETDVPFTYIADGHHRAASAAKVSQQFPQNQQAKYFLTTIFPASELAILDYNRLVADLNGLSIDQLLKAIEENFTIEKKDKAFRPGKLHEFGLYIDQTWFKLEARSASYSTDPIGVLDVTILSNNLLDKVLGIRDQRIDKRIDFVGGIRGLGELEKRVDSGEMKLGLSLYPVSIDQLFEIADSGNVMPPKSTWFEPKLRDGLLTHSL